MTEESNLTGYPSIDKPWLKYYSAEAISAPLPKMTMYQYIWENNKDHLSDIALRYYGTKITYGKLFENIRKAASAFYSLGVRSGDIVTIMSMHTPETVYAIYALNYIGATANMAYMTLTGKEILKTVENTKSKLIILLDAALSKLDAIESKLNVPVVVLGVADSMPLYMKLGYSLKHAPKKHSFLSWQNLISDTAIEPPLSVDHASASIIVYTSGTTGKPKGVILSSDNLNAIPDQLAKTDRNYQRQETFLHTIPIFVAFGVGMLHHGISVGICMILGIVTDFPSMGKLFSKYKPQRFVSGPPVLDCIMQYTKGSLNNFIDFTGGGEAIAPEKEERFNRWLADHHASTKYLAGYGMSEFASVATLNLRKACKSGSVGIPLVHANIKITDPESGEEQRFSNQGEICICAPNTMIGYFNDKEETDKAIEVDEFGRRWMHTGDIGYVDPDGFLFVVGRLKRVYLTRADDGSIVKMYPTYIEDIIIGDASVVNCGVIAQEHAEKLHTPIAFVTLNESKKDDAADRLMSLARSELPEYDYPEKIFILDSMPMTPSGKIDYLALEEMAKEM